MSSSQDANSLVGCPSRHINDFFTRNALDYQTRNQCLRFAQLIFPEELVGEADTQGECSYTVAVSTTHLLQFRPGRFSLDMEIYKDARHIFKHLVSETTYLGPFSGIPAPRSPHINPPLLHVYLMDKVPGVTLSGILQIHDNPHREFRHNLVRDMAAIFAKSYHHRVPSRRRHTLPAGKGIQGRIGSSLRWRANLLTSIADAKLSQEAQATKYHLGHIERLPWCLTHGDLIPSNIMVDPQTGHITGLLDWAEGEWLPLGIGMYAVDECLGQDDAEKGFVYFDDHAELRALFWRTFLGLCEGHTPARNGVLKLSEVEMARRLGLLLWRGIAFDDGRLDRLVEAGRDDGELNKLRVLLDAPSLLESISTP
ncbi:Protein kinase-like domain protein [Metarhizium guizhouense ARSEF 977]|uniref:Protein kinase-like domain protein n=1 Tax=Metarhizium guizhouense (strain ARSEF 977) TaxID=1276136 RepID=A0A0B4H6L6_METGA|nr:Protein kinase-like domain protein [Metarhizium guizhouense ARSEF 977]